tara:strand:+ start:1927 stop:2451 length:525 start_codon:yes stop_codon:yes gene_type:complete
MPRLSVNLSKDDLIQLGEYCKNHGFTTKASAIVHCIISALKSQQNSVKGSPFPSHVTGVASLPNNNILYGNEVPKETFSPDSSKKLTQKKPPPQDLPENWQPSEHLRGAYCSKYGVKYHDALTLFKSLVHQEGERSRNWDATWNVKLMKGVLKHTPSDNDDIRYEDTMAYEFGN